MKNSKRKNITKIKNKKKINNYKKDRFTPIDEKEFLKMKKEFHKTLPKFHFLRNQRLHISYAYYGAGFTGINLVEREKLNNKYTMLDINHAYQYALVNYNYPIGSKWHYKYDTKISYKNFIKKYKGQHFIVLCKFYKMKEKYKDFDYNIYKRNFITYNDEKGMFYYAWLCDIDMENLHKIYTCETVITHAIFFDEFGKLPKKCIEYVTNNIEKLDSLPKNSEERKNFKVALHIVTYGKSAQKVGFDGARSEYVPIALYQVAYVRQYMIDLFIKYRSMIAYIDTDCFIIKHTKQNLKHFSIGNKLGQFKKEFENKKCFLCRVKGYFVFDNNKVIIQKFSGIKTKLTYRQVNDIIKGKDFYVNELKTIDGKKVNQKVLVRNDYLNGYKLKI